MSRKKDMTLLAAGILAGTLLAGPAAQAAAQLTATPSTQAFYVDGERVDLEAYVINGSNYVKLRDIGRKVDFSVAYDSTTNSVQVDSSNPYVEESGTAPPAAVVPAGVIQIQPSGEQLTLKEGDKVLCDDGTVYEITDMSLHDNRTFTAGLPTPTCDWSQFPKLELPQMAVRRYSDRYGDDLFVLNLYETRRMQYTLYNCVPNCPELWEGGELKRYADGTPILRLQLGISEQTSVQTFWPWREDQLTQVFYSAPGASFAVEAWDVYHDGTFLHTRYNIQGR